jgi:hypothetical protein
MTENELLYYHPYYFDRQYNLKSFGRNEHDFYDIVLGKHDIKYENGETIHFRHNGHFSEKEKIDNQLTFSTAFSWFEWFKGGQNIFAFTEEILEMLQYTDVDEISIDSIKLPYNRIYISLRPLNLILDKYPDEIIEGVYVYQNPHLSEGNTRIEMNFVGNFYKTHFDNYQIKGLPKVYSGKFWSYDLDFSQEHGIKTIKQSLDDELEVLNIEFEPDEQSGIISNEQTNAFKDRKILFINDTIKLTINCLLYLSLPSDKKDVILKYPQNLPHNFDRKLKFSKTEKEKSKVETKIKSFGFSKIHFVGTSFKRENNKGSNSSTISPHWRRGHWRNQKFGENLACSKLLWIMPTIVNKDKGEPTKGHLYSVEPKN